MIIKIFQTFGIKQKRKFITKQELNAIFRTVRKKLFQLFEINVYNFNREILVQIHFLRY